MKALSVRQPWAQLIADGEKTVEVRSRDTRHRGPLAIHASAKPDTGMAAECKGLLFGVVVCIVDVVDSRPLTLADVDPALLPDDWTRSECDGLFAWVLANPRLVEPVAAKGKLNFWHLEDREITYL